MSLLESHRAREIWGTLFILSLLFTGCSGIEPYHPHDYREKGLEKGLFTDSKGEFVIFRKADEPAEESEL